MSNAVRVRLTCLSVASVLLFAPTAFVKAADKSAVTSARVAALKPGEYIWAPALAPKGPMLIVVSLSAQRAYVYRNAVRIGATTVSTGREGRETPTGVFTVLEKQRFHRSNRYNNAPMPFMQRLTWSGIALHGGPLPARLHPLTAVIRPRFVRRHVPRRDRGDHPGRSHPVRPAGGGLLAQPSATGALAAGQAPYTWTPQIAPDGPVSILVSVHDERLIVLRNGKLIGSGRIHLPPGQLIGTQALVFTGFNAAGQSQWIYLDVPGQESTKGKSPKLLSGDELQIAPAYLQLVRSVLKPGATVVATDGSLAEGDAGQGLMLIESGGR